MAGVVLFNIYIDLTNEEPELPHSLTLENFDEMMNLQAECNITTAPDSNSYIRNKIVAQFFTS